MNNYFHNVVNAKFLFHQGNGKKVKNKNPDVPLSLSLLRDYHNFLEGFKSTDLLELQRLILNSIIPTSRKAMQTWQSIITAIHTPILGIYLVLLTYSRLLRALNSGFFLSVHPEMR